MSAFRSPWSIHQIVKAIRIWNSGLKKLIFQLTSWDKNMSLRHIYMYGNEQSNRSNISATQYLNVKE